MTIRFFNVSSSRCTGLSSQGRSDLRFLDSLVVVPSELCCSAQQFAGFWIEPGRIARKADSLAFRQFAALLLSASLETLNHFRQKHWNTIRIVRQLSIKNLPDLVLAGALREFDQAALQLDVFQSRRKTLISRLHSVDREIKAQLQDGSEMVILNFTQHHVLANDVNSLRRRQHNRQ